MEYGINAVFAISCLAGSCQVTMSQVIQHWFTNITLLNVIIQLIWQKVFKNGPSKICGKEFLKNWRGMVCFRQTISLQIFYRLPSTNFTWSILESFILFIGIIAVFAISCLAGSRQVMMLQVIQHWFTNITLSNVIIQFIWPLTRNWKLDPWQWRSTSGEKSN